MGTNYFVKTGNKKKVVCEYGCEHIIDEQLHIGKSSYGWKFCLHIMPEKNINELKDWINILKNGKITNEYGEEVSFDKMMDIIKNPPIPNDLEEVYKEISPFGDMRIDGDNRLYYYKDTLGKDGGYVIVVGEFS